MVFKSIHMQLSMEQYGASQDDRGALLDTIDLPVSDCAWLRLQIPEIRKQPDEAARLAAVERIANWTDPGPGGFYDDLGNHCQGQDPHVIRAFEWAEDPGFLFGVSDEHNSRGLGNPMRSSWIHFAQIGLFGPALRYTGLDTEAAYVLRATYADRNTARIQLYLDGRKAGEPCKAEGDYGQTYEFEVPRPATADGVLDVTFEATQGGGRIAEVWLIKKPLP